MKDSTINIYFFFLISYMFLAQFYIVYTIVNISNEPVLVYLNETKPEPMKRYDDGFLANNITGVYIPGCAYLVDTRGRDNEDIILTDAHEQVHEMISQNQKCGNISCKEHFCGG